MVTILDVRVLEYKMKSKELYLFNSLIIRKKLENAMYYNYMMSTCPSTVVVLDHMM